MNDTNQYQKKKKKEKITVYVNFSNSNKRDKSKGQKKGGRLDRGCTKYATDGYL